MTQRFRFADAFWFRVPMKVLVLAVSVFGLISIWPALTEGDPHQFQRAIVGLLVLVIFLALATTFSVAIQDSYIDVDGASLFIRFEAFFSAAFPLEDIVAVRNIDPRPAWRYRFGLSTDFAERVACSHGGRIVEIEFAHAWRTRVGPRRIGVRRLWVAVLEHEALIDVLKQSIDSQRSQTPSFRKRAA